MLWQKAAVLPTAVSYAAFWEIRSAAAHPTQALGSAPQLAGQLCLPGRNITWAQWLNLGFLKQRQAYSIAYHQYHAVRLTSNRVADEEGWLANHFLYECWQLSAPGLKIVKLIDLVLPAN